MRIMANITEDFYGGRYAKVATNYAINAANIDVTGAGSSSAYIFTVGDVLKNSRTGENMLVTAINNAGNISITKAYGTTADLAGVSGDGLFICGNVSEENSGARNVNTTESSKQTNYCQIFKTTIALSNTEKESNLYGGKDKQVSPCKI